MENLTDIELRNELIKYGFTPGPVGETTRSVYLKKLKRMTTNKSLTTISTDDNESDEPDSSMKKPKKKKQLIKVSGNGTENDSASKQQEANLSPNILLPNYNYDNSETYIRGRKSIRDSSMKSSKIEDPTFKLPNNYSETVANKYRNFDYSRKKGHKKWFDFFLSSEIDNLSGISRKPQIISALIIAVFGIFISVIFYFYIDKRLLGINRPHVLELCKGNKKDDFCMTDVKNIHSVNDIAKSIYDVLNVHEGNRICQENLNPWGLKTEILLKQVLTDLRRDKPDVSTSREHFHKAFKLISEHREWNIRLYDKLDKETSIPKEVERISCISPSLPLYCRIIRSLKRLALYILSIMVIILLLVVLYIGRISLKRRAERRKHEMYEMVNRVLDFFEEEAADKRSRNEDSIIIVPIIHVRDKLIPAMDRKKINKLWTESVKFLKDNESKLTELISVVNGEEFECWKWNESLKNGNNKIWQGKAVKEKIDQVNIIGYCECLKVRNMFDPDKEVEENWHVAIENAILEKCSESDICHISVEKASKEGCVYLKCKTKLDAGKAFQQLRGWWFNKHLVSVKYLTLERYYRRFPDSINFVDKLEPREE